ANTEDHVSMGTIAARKARKVIENVSNVLAIELLCATEALSFRLGEQKITDPKTENLPREQRKKISVDQTGECGTGTFVLYNMVRSLKKHSLLQGKDRVLSEMIEEGRALLKNDPGV